MSQGPERGMVPERIVTGIGPEHGMGPEPVIAGMGPERVIGMGHERVAGMGPERTTGIPDRPGLYNTPRPSYTLQPSTSGIPASRLVQPQVSLAYSHFPSCTTPLLFLYSPWLRS